MEQPKFVIHSEVEKYLEKLIKSIGVQKYKLTIQPGSLKGDNYLGIIAKVLVDGEKDGKNIKLRWIAKSSPQNPTFRELASIAKVFEREIYTYKEIFPIFKKFQADKCVKDSFKSVPPFIGSYLEPYKEVVVMEDMNEMGFTLKNRKEALDLEHAKSIMITYGKFHAISYALKDQNPKLLEGIKKNTQEILFSSMPEDLFVKREEAACNKSFSALDPVEHSWHRDVFTKYKEKSFKIVVDTFKKSYQDPYSVVCHGDCWVNNMLFKYEVSKFYF